MVCKLFPLVLFLLREVVLIQCQTFIGDKCTATNSIEQDILMRVRKQDIEISSLKRRCFDTERVLKDDRNELHDRVLELESNFVALRNETLENQRGLENELQKKQTIFENELNETNSRLIQLELEFITLQNETSKRQTELESELNKTQMDRDNLKMELKEKNDLITELFWPKG